MAKPKCRSHGRRGCSECKRRADSRSNSDTLSSLFVASSYDSWSDSGGYSSSHDSGSSSSSYDSGSSGGYGGGGDF